MGWPERPASPGVSSEIRALCNSDAGEDMCPWRRRGWLCVLSAMESLLLDH